MGCGPAIGQHLLQACVIGMEPEQKVVYVDPWLKAMTLCTRKDRVQHGGSWPEWHLVFANTFEDIEFAFPPLFFNTEVLVLDADGMEIFANDDATYDEDMFDLGPEAPGGPFGSDNSFIANLLIAEAGTYR